MIEKVYIVLMIGVMLITFIGIFKNFVSRQRQQRNKEIIKLNKNLHFLALGLIWFIFFIIWSAIFINKVRDAYHLLHNDYINSVLQLINIEYLESLRNYFYKKSMLMELMTIVQYKKNLLNMLTWIVGSLCMAIFYLYIGWQENVIYDNGILIHNKVLNWREIIDYEWSNAYEKKLFQKGRYYDLILTLPRWKFFKLLDSEVKLRINHDNRERINNILNKYTNN
ncbi:hypothetical protein QBE52_12765 [Clostridiaceae bacterium 35-E11]